MLGTELCEEGPLTFAGVSGGATLGLALALAGLEDRGRRCGSGATARPGPHAFVVHEPLLGPLAPELHASVTASADRLAADEDAAGFLSRLVGQSCWEDLDPTWRHAALANAAVVRAEVPRFAAFAPESDDLSCLSDRQIVVTVGARSPRARHEAAEALAEHSGARVQVVPGTGHLVQFEQPDYWSALVDRVAAGEQP